MKAHHAFTFEAEVREYDNSQARISVNNGAGGIGFGMAYVSGIGNGTHASLTPQMARDLAQDLIERADELDPPSKLTFRVSTSRDATSEEVSSLLYGTGSLSWEWWGGCDAEERDGVAGYLFTHATEDSPDDGSTPGRTWVSEQQILDAAARAIAEGYGDEDRKDIIGESIGYFDGGHGDVVLQFAVLGKAVFG